MSAATHVDWAVSPGLTDYPAAVEAMEARVRAIRDGAAPELVWLIEHPALYTSGTSAKPEDLRTPDRFPVFNAGRGGQFTYHGPGQRVAYVMLDVAARGRDVRAFVAGLETWIVAALAELEVASGTRDGRVGVWVDRGDGGGEDKIAAIGVRLRRWVSFHGLSLNVAPDLGHFDGITPCGIDDPRYGVTSLEALGAPATMAAADAALRRAFETVFRSRPVNVPPPIVDLA